MKEKIFTNSAWLFSAQAIVKVIAFIYTIFLAAALGVEQFGLYITALAYFSLFSSVTDFGFNRFLIREGAKSPQKLSEYLQTVLLTRITLTSVFFALISVLLYWLDSDVKRVNLVALALLAVVPQAIAFTLDAALVAEEKMRVSAVGFVILSLANLIIGYSLIQSGAGSTGAVIAVGLSQLFYSGVLFIFLHRTGFGWQNKVYWQHLKEIAKGSLPYGILGILGLVYFRIDALLLTYLKGSYEAGIYGVAFRFLEAVVFIPSALATALFPVLSRLHQQDTAQIKKLYFSSLKIIGLISLVIMMIFLGVLPWLINLALPQYLESIAVLRVLSLTIPFMFLHVIGTIVLLSSEKLLKPVIYLSLGTVTFNIVLNLIFIPLYGVMGVAYVTVLSEALSFVVFFLLLYYKLLRNA